MPLCHSGDRGFESPRARQNEQPGTYAWLFAFKGFQEATGEARRFLEAWFYLRRGRSTSLLMRATSLRLPSREESAWR